MPRAHGVFSLTGDFDPDEITEQIGIEPDWIHRKGDIYPSACRPSLSSMWCLFCDKHDYGDVSDQIISLLCKLEEAKTDVSKLCKRYKGKFELVAYLNGNHRGFWLDADLIRRLSDLHVVLDCEYTYAPEGPLEEDEIWETENGN